MKIIPFFLFAFLSFIFPNPVARAAEKVRVCTPRALAVWNQVPDFKYECGGDFIDRDDPVRRAALSGYAKKLASLSERWWSISTEELNACAVKKKSGTISKEEREDFSLMHWTLQGDSELRFVGSADPCLTPGTSSFPFNGFLLSRREDKTVVTQVLDEGRSSNEYAPVTLGITSEGGKKFVILKEFSGSLHPACKFDAFQITNSGKAEPENLFWTGAGKVASVSSLCDLELYGSDRRPEPEVLKKGKLAAQFFTYSEREKCADSNQQCPPVQRRFTWASDHYVIDHYESEHDKFEKADRERREKLGKLRTCLKEKFDPKTGESPCENLSEFTCESANDLAWLNWKAGNMEIALRHAKNAESSCHHSGSDQELQAARYNYEQIQKELKKGK
ncbi:MAG: hypothetical protein U1F57_03470 [bacterium]